MIVVDSQKAYQGAYAEWVQNRQNAHQMTEAQKDAATERVKAVSYTHLTLPTIA